MAFPQTQLSRPLSVPALALALGLAALASGCGPKKSPAASGGPGAKPSAAAAGTRQAPGPKPTPEPEWLEAGEYPPPPEEDPASPPDPLAGRLNPERVELPALGYSLRVPLGWGESDRRPSDAIDLYLVHPDTGASIAISRRPARFRRYVEWRGFAQNLTETLKATLREPRVLSEEFFALNGMIVFAIEHTHQARGAFYFSKKAAVYAGGLVYVIDFNVPLEAKDAALPAFEAFLRGFRLLDPTLSRLDAAEPDYIGEHREPGRGLVVPVQRFFRRNDPPGVQGLIARWAYDEHINLTLADHVPPPIELEAYGDFQRDNVLKRQGYEILDSRIVELGGRWIYRIDFEPGEGLRSALFLAKSGRRYYLFQFTADDFSFPYFEKVASGIVADSTIPAG